MSETMSFLKIWGLGACRFMSFWGKNHVGPKISIWSHWFCLWSCQPDESRRQGPSVLAIMSASQENMSYATPLNSRYSSAEMKFNFSAQVYLEEHLPFCYL